MTPRLYLAAALMGLLPMLSSAAAAPTRACHLPGVEEPLRCLTLAVPLDHAHPDGKRIGKGQHGLRIIVRSQGHFPGFHRFLAGIFQGNFTEIWLDTFTETQR